MSAQCPRPGLASETSRLLSIARSQDLKTVLVSAVILRDVQERVLIATRPQGKSMAGMWEFPGGKLEPGETPVQGLRRELAEELGIQIDDGSTRYFTTVKYDYPDFILIMPTYECRSWSGIISGREGQEVAWVEVGRLAERPMPPADAPLVELLQRGRG